MTCKKQVGGMTGRLYIIGSNTLRLTQSLLITVTFVLRYCNSLLAILIYHVFVSNEGLRFLHKPFLLAISSP
jgi:hypothetical protein